MFIYSAHPCSVFSVEVVIYNIHISLYIVINIKMLSMAEGFVRVYIPRMTHGEFCLTENSASEKHDILLTPEILVYRQINLGRPSSPQPLAHPENTERYLGVWFPIPGLPRAVIWACCL